MKHFTLSWAAALFALVVGGCQSQESSQIGSHGGGGGGPSTPDLFAEVSGIGNLETTGSITLHVVGRGQSAEKIFLEMSADSGDALGLTLHYEFMEDALPSSASELRLVMSDPKWSDRYIAVRTAGRRFVLDADAVVLKIIKAGGVQKASWTSGGNLLDLSRDPSDASFVFRENTTTSASGNLRIDCSSMDAEHLREAGEPDGDVAADPSWTSTFCQWAKGDLTAKGWL